MKIPACIRNSALDTTLCEGNACAHSAGREIRATYNDINQRAENSEVFPKDTVDVP